MGDTEQAPVGPADTVVFHSRPPYICAIPSLPEGSNFTHDAVWSGTPLAGLEVEAYNLTQGQTAVRHDVDGWRIGAPMAALCVGSSDRGAEVVEFMAGIGFLTLTETTAFAAFRRDNTNGENVFDNWAAKYSATAIVAFDYTSVRFATLEREQKRFRGGHVDRQILFDLGTGALVIQTPLSNIETKANVDLGEVFTKTVRATIKEKLAATSKPRDIAHLEQLEAGRWPTTSAGGFNIEFPEPEPATDVADNQKNAEGTSERSEAATTAGLPTSGHSADELDEEIRASAAVDDQGRVYEPGLSEAAKDRLKKRRLAGEDFKFRHKP